MKPATLGSLLALVLGFGSGAAIAQTPPPRPGFDLEQALTDFAQRTTLAFDGLGMLTGNLEAQSFFPPGKVADYWGFQYLRDNDPSDMGHNTSFLTRAACNVLFILTDEQLASLKSLASSQIGAINQYAYRRYPLMKAFRRLVDGSLPAGATGLDVAAVRAASRELYRLDGQISYDRAVLYARIFRTLSPGQKSWLDAMVGKGWASWPAKDMEDVRARLQGLSNDESVAVMTYAGDMFSWYAGSLDADVYFCPERHGTYFGSFYMKDAPAIGHEGYSIDEQLTATAGSALCDASKGYVTADQAAIVSSLVDAQRSNLYAGASNIVKARTTIATALRSLITPAEPSTAFLEQVKTTVLAESAVYGQLDGENAAAYATAFAQVNASLSTAQRTHLLDLRRSFMAGTYADGTSFDFTVCSTPFLYAAVIADTATLAPYVSNTDYLFNVPATPTAAFTFSPPVPTVGQTVTFSDASTGNPTSWSWTFGDGATSAARNPSHAFTTAGTFNVELKASNAQGSGTARVTLTVRASGAGGTAPIAAFTVSPAAAIAGEMVTFSDASTGSPTSWSWTFGDGGTSTAQNPTHAFSSAGTFTVSLTAANPDGQSSSSRQITVSAGFTRWVLSVSHVPGANGTQWRSDVALLNTGSTAASARLLLFTSGGVLQATTAVPAGSQVVVTDVAGRLGLDGSGALEVVSDQPLVVTSRTYDQLPSGTVGQEVASCPASAGLGTGQSAWIPQLSQNAAARTNIALTNTGVATAEVTVTLFDGSGNALGSYHVTLPPGRWAQENQPYVSKAGRTDVTGGYARITVTSGSGVLAAGSVIDSITNDPTTVAMVRP